MHFTTQDLARTRLAETPDALWETVLSTHMLHARYGKVVFADWRQLVRRDLQRHDMVGRTRRLSSIAPDGSYFPDFLTPPEGLLGIEAGAATVAATPRTRIRTELTKLNDRSGTPSWAWELAEGRPAARADLGRLIAGYFHRAVAPYWPRMLDRAAADRGMRVRALRQGGVPALLETFRPHMRWRPPVLEVNSPVTRDLYLEGRGLTLIPSQFCWNCPIPFADPALPPTLIYPMARDSHWLEPTPPQATSPLDRLLGPTRAAVLEACVTAPNTTEIARRLNVSRATVSQHTAVLREAGLITSRRHDNNVLHVTTTLGAALLHRAAPDQ